MKKLQRGAFDSAHNWTGDRIDGEESDVFQQGKLKALRKLLPFAHSESDREAASVVLELDGSEFGFWVGEKYNVESFVPTNRPCAHFHTHPDPEPQSQDDWPEFLLAKSVLQAHVIAPNATYSLHKPLAWRLAQDLNTRESIAEALYDSYEQAQYEALKHGLSLNDIELDERATKVMAQRCGIIFRIGKRKEDERHEEKNKC